MKINTYHKKYKRIGSHGHCHAPYVVCKDGFTVSIQASDTHYCSPRKIVDLYREMELGYPSDEEELIMPYCEDESKPCNTVYGFVPVKIINEMLEKHGGIDIDATLEERSIVYGNV